MADLPLNHQLTSRGAEFIEATESAAKYRLYALAGGPPMRPGMVRVNEDGRAIKLEIWRMPAAAFASFVELIPSPLGIGTVETASGKRIPGFICEQAGLLALLTSPNSAVGEALASKAVSSVKPTTTTRQKKPSDI